MLMVVQRLLIASVPLVLTCSACSMPDTVTRMVEGKRFDIPRKNIMDATIFFLLASQNDTVRFVINPSAPLPEQNMVSFHLEATCPPSDGSMPRDPRCKIKPITLTRLERAKLTRTGDDVWWQYRSADTGELVAYCSALWRGVRGCAATTASTKALLIGSAFEIAKCPA